MARILATRRKLCSWGSPVGEEFDQFILVQKPFLKCFVEGDTHLKKSDLQQKIKSHTTEPVLQPLPRCFMVCVQGHAHTHSPDPLPDPALLL